MCRYIKKSRQGHNVSVIYNKKKTNTTNYYLTFDEAYFTEHIIKQVSNGKKVFIGSDSKKQTELLELRMKAMKVNKMQVKVKVYNSDTDDESRNALSEVNTEWVKYDVVICSPTILYGVDFNAEHFDYVYGYYNKTIMASSIYQQLNRVRKIKSNEAIVFMQWFTGSNVHPMPTTIKEIGAYYFRYCKEYATTLV